MSLVKCLECSKYISNKIGTICPKCGFKIDESSILEIEENDKLLKKQEEDDKQKQLFKDKQIGFFGLFITTWISYTACFLLLYLLGEIFISEFDFKPLIIYLNLENYIKDNYQIYIIYHVYLGFLVMNGINFYITKKYFKKERITKTKKYTNYIFGILFSSFNILVFFSDKLQKNLIELISLAIMVAFTIAFLNNKNTVRIR